MDIRDNLTREGEVGEMMVTIDLTKKGYIVSTPNTSSSPYDKIVDLHGNLQKLQVKSMRLLKNGCLKVPLRNRKNSSVAKNNKGRSHNYVKLVDYIAVWIKDTSDVFYIPTAVLPKDKSTVLFRSKKHLGRSKAPLIENYTNLEDGFKEIEKCRNPFSKLKLFWKELRNAN